MSAGTALSVLTALSKTPMGRVVVNRAKGTAKGLIKTGVKSAIKKSPNIVKKVADVTKKAKYITDRVKAAGSLAKTVANPKNQAKFVRDAIRGEGFVLPGSKYIGPGNRMDKGKPVDQADANAYQHDVDYDNYLKKGHKAKDVYLGYSDADERLLKNTKANTASGMAVNLGMLAKKGLNKLGLTKRIRDTDDPRAPKNRKGESSTGEIMKQQQQFSRATRGPPAPPSSLTGRQNTSEI